MKVVVAAVIVASVASGVARQRDQTQAQAPIGTPAASAGGEFVAFTHRSMPYRLFVPKNYDPQRRYPLILWLHGTGGRGTDNTAQIVGDQIPGTQLWTTPKLQAEHPAFVLAPQTNDSWGVVEGMPPDLSSDLAVVVEILDAVAGKFPIDAKRVYVLGQSIGARGVWLLASNKPERFAAAILLCPTPGDTTRLAATAMLPIWIFQGDADVARYVAGSRALVEALKAAGGHPRYTEYPNMKHDIWTLAFEEPTLAPWLFAQHR